MAFYVGSFVRKRKNKSGTVWRGTLSYYDESGEQRQVATTFGPEVRSKSQAVQALEAWRARMEAERAAPDASLTVAEYVRSYLDGRERAGANEASTLLGYRTIEKRIAAAFPKTKLRDLRAKDVQAWEARMLGDGLSNSTVAKSLKLLKQVCEHAVEVEDLQRNPCNPVKPPKVRYSEPRALDDDGRRALLSKLDALEPSAFVTAVYIALLTGMRQGEVCGLRWRNVDLDKPEIRVTEAIGNGTGGAYLKDTKNAASRRTVPIPSQLVDALHRRRATQYAAWAESRLAVGLPATDRDFGAVFVVGGVDGSFKNPNLLGKEWHRFAEDNGIRDGEGRPLRFHGLRDTHATMLISNNVDPKSVAATLGHSSVAMTLNKYASASADAMRRAAETTEREYAPREAAEVMTLTQASGE